MKRHVLTGTNEQQKKALLASAEVSYVCGLLDSSIDAMYVRMYVCMYVRILGLVVINERRPSIKGSF